MYLVNKYSQILVLSLLAMANANAGQVTSEFIDGTVLGEGQMNEIKAAVNGNDTSITSLSGRVAALETPATPPRFIDNGNGTISDNETGLMWEQKINSDGTADLANPQDADNTYTWNAGTPTTSRPDGTVITEFLDRINCLHNTCTSTAGGYSDWQLPTISELRTITNVSGCTVAPCIIDSIFAPNPGAYYWTRSNTFDIDYAKIIRYDTGANSSFYKPSAQYVRAVRRFKY